jgi:hypothetical protein
MTNADIPTHTHAHTCACVQDLADPTVFEDLDAKLRRAIGPGGRVILQKKSLAPKFNARSVLVSSTVHVISSEYM